MTFSSVSQYMLLIFSVVLDADVYNASAIYVFEVDGVLCDRTLVHSVHVIIIVEGFDLRSKSKI